jgi:hypothetical protein
MLRPVRSFAATPPVHSNNFKIQNPPVVQAGAAGFLRIYKLAVSTLYDPFPHPESERK